MVWCGRKLKVGGSLGELNTATALVPTYRSPSLSLSRTTQLDETRVGVVATFADAFASLLRGGDQPGRSINRAGPNEGLGWGARANVQVQRGGWVGQVTHTANAANMPLPICYCHCHAMPCKPWKRWPRANPFMHHQVISPSPMSIIHTSVNK